MVVGFVLTIFCLGLVVGNLLTLARYRPTLKPERPALQQQLDALEQRMQALEQRLTPSP